MTDNNDLDDADLDLFDFDRPRNPNPDIGLRYSRSERLKKAPEIVQRLYDGSYTKKPGIVKGLLSSRSSRYMLIVILLMIFIIGIIYFLPQNTGSLNNIKASLSCQAVPEAVFANLKIEPDNALENTESRDLIVAFTAFDKSGEVLETRRLETIYIGQELFLSVDFKFFNIEKIQADILIEEKSLSLIHGL